MTTTTPTADATRDTTGPATARSVVVWSSVAALAADLVLMSIIGVIIPPLAVFAVLSLGAVAATRRWPRSGVVALAVLALVANGGGLAFLLADLGHPSDSIAFLWAVGSGGGRVVAIVAAVLALTRRDRAARGLATASLAVLVLAVIGSLAARFTVTADAAEPGDVEVIAEAVTFPDRVEVPAGGAVLVDNRDPMRHTFAIEGTDLDVVVEPGVQRRIPIELPAGTYTFVCTVPGHESMTGTLEVG
jgi:plastocyanin